MKKLATAAFIFVGVSSTCAQDGPQTFVSEPRCWLGSITFSPGATIRASNKVMICETGGTWAASDEAASGCILEGKFSSTGTLEGVSNNKAVSIECMADGAWKVIPNTLQ